jgi:hypothetical protein
LISRNPCILEAPELSPLLPKRVQPEGSLYLLVCHTIAGTKPVFFQWNKNGLNLSNNPESHFKIDNNDDNSQFAIKSVDKKDSGNYSCIARNAFGADIQSTLLIVKGLIQKFNSFQNFDLIFKNVLFI